MSTVIDAMEINMYLEDKSSDEQHSMVGITPCPPKYPRKELTFSRIGAGTQLTSGPLLLNELLFVA